MFCFSPILPSTLLQLSTEVWLAARLSPTKFKSAKLSSPVANLLDFSYPDLPKIASTISPDLTERMDKRVSLSCRLTVSVRCLLGGHWPCRKEGVRGTYAVGTLTATL